MTLEMLSQRYADFPVRHTFVHFPTPAAPRMSQSAPARLRQAPSIQPTEPVEQFEDHIALLEPFEVVTGTYTELVLPIPEPPNFVADSFFAALAPVGANATAPAAIGAASSSATAAIGASSSSAAAPEPAPAEKTRKKKKNKSERKRAALSQDSAFATQAEAKWNAEVDDQTWLPLRLPVDEVFPLWCRCNYDWDQVRAMLDLD